MQKYTLILDMTAKRHCY